MATRCLSSQNKLIQDSPCLCERERCMAIFLNHADVRRNHLLQMLVLAFYLLSSLETGPEQIHCTDQRPEYFRGRIGNLIRDLPSRSRNLSLNKLLDTFLQFLLFPLTGGTFFSNSMFKRCHHLCAIRPLNSS